MAAADALTLTIALLALSAAGVAFWRPRGTFRIAGYFLITALAAPLALGFALAPFLGSGAGLGVALILIVLAATIAAIAVAAALGATLRYGWNALR